MKDHWVYWMYCNSDCLLYVGITVNLDARLANHQVAWPEMHRIHRVEMKLYPSKTEALAVEQVEIEQRWPRFNSTHHPFPWWKHYKERRDFIRILYGKPCHGPDAAWPWERRDR